MKTNQYYDVMAFDVFCFVLFCLRFKQMNVFVMDGIRFAFLKKRNKNKWTLKLFRGIKFVSKILILKFVLLRFSIQCNWFLTAIMHSGNTAKMNIFCGCIATDALRMKSQLKILMKFSLFAHGYEPSSKYIGH